MKAFPFVHMMTGMARWNLRVTLLYCIKYDYMVELLELEVWSQFIKKAEEE